MEAAFIIYGIISLATLIAFFVMAGNVAAIRKTLDAMQHNDDSTNYIAPYNLGKVREYQGKPTEALDHYYEAYYKIHKYIKVKPQDPQNQRNKSLIEARITGLGGSLKEIS